MSNSQLSVYIPIEFETLETDSAILSYDAPLYLIFKLNLRISESIEVQIPRCQLHHNACSDITEIYHASTMKFPKVLDNISYI